MKTPIPAKNQDPAATEASFTKCPECGAELQATVKLYLYEVAVTADGAVLSYEGGPKPEDESDILELCDMQDTSIYCANDHPFDPAKAKASPAEQITS